MGLWRRYLAWRLRHVVQLEATETGFLRQAYRAKREVRWNEVRRVVAYKQDLYAVDLLCLAVEDGAGSVDLDEDMPGFESVLGRLECALGIAPEWRLTVLFPAFELNLAVLYERAG